MVPRGLGGGLRWRHRSWPTYVTSCADDQVNRPASWARCHSGACKAGQVLAPSRAVANTTNPLDPVVRLPMRIPSAIPLAVRVCELVAVLKPAALDEELVPRGLGNRVGFGSDPPDELALLEYAQVPGQLSNRRVNIPVTNRRIPNRCVPDSFADKLRSPTGDHRLEQQA